MELLKYMHKEIYILDIFGVYRIYLQYKKW